MSTESKRRVRWIARTIDRLGVALREREEVDLLVAEGIILEGSPRKQSVERRIAGLKQWLIHLREGGDFRFPPPEAYNR